jgi:hypothetical protein
MVSTTSTSQIRFHVWILFLRFKLHLRPKHLATSHVQDNDLPPLPPSKTALDVFADFLRYLHTHSIDYIKKSRDPQFWSSIENSIDYVLTHPNGWEGPQQALMRQAAIRAGLITNDDDDSRLQFVTEGEASLHYCINKGIMSEPDMVRIFLDTFSLGSFLVVSEIGSPRNYHR